MQLLLQALVRNMSYYAVARGRKIGVFGTWAECSEKVKKFPNACYKKFKTRDEADAFIKSNSETPISDPYIQTKNQAQSSSVKQKEFWPEHLEGGKEGGDAVLLTAIKELEGLKGKCGTAPGKRKAEAAAEATPYKFPRIKSKVYHISDYQCINGHQFAIDSDGFVLVYTDGSCLNNGKRGASAGFGVYFGENHSLNVGLPVTGRATNNVGEIQAAIHAIKEAQRIGIQKLCINTDSQFLMNAINLWVPNWKKKNWQLSGGGKVKNIDEFKVLDELIESGDMCIKWNYIRAHMGIAGNEAADALAREGSLQYMLKGIKKK